MRNSRRTAVPRIASMLCSAFVALALVADAGPARGQGLSLGVEGGATSSDMSVSDGSLDLDRTTGYRVAGVLRFGFAGPVGIQTGVGLAQKGAAVPTTGTGLQGDMDFNLSYVEVPLLLTASIPLPSPVSPRLFAGGQVGFESSCDMTTDISGVSGSVDCSSDQLGEAALATNGTTFDLVVGGGVDFSLAGPLTLTLDGRYDLGMSDISDVSDASAASLRNRAMTVSAGVLLSLP